jgi:glucosamine--fructose-6-phosphate aminotransferase (isomerizing)
MIRDIPNGFKSTLEVMTEMDTGLPQKKSMTCTGSGTAFFASLMGSQMLGPLDIRWRPVQSFELANYESMSENNITVGVSHSGITKSTIDALRYAREKSSYVLALTHFPNRPISGVADRTFVIGNGPDLSRCHTKTYVDSAAATLKLSLAYAKSNGRSVLDIEKEFEKNLSTKLISTIGDTEDSAKKLVQDLPHIGKVLFAGAGPNLVTAREGALKIKESSFIQAEGLELEEILHGPWVSFDEETLVVVLCVLGPSSERAKDLLRAAKLIGAKSLAITDDSAEADYVIKVPKTHEYLSPFLNIIPIYFLAYYMAIQRGNNPDFLRYLHQKYWDARQVIFPPGTH